ncbi:hypothetical protein FGO68_gene15163 [Halteria grandinella]|uniref:Uncharacterized protein n=1 Tax=Halteria grandinella TaxID=5974 RepID=A0A8J8NJV2_HALGN|nr:hypothetical protein FGO68_gene15163 [Halteria grandinella]
MQMSAQKILTSNYKNEQLQPIREPRAQYLLSATATGRLPSLPLTATVPRSAVSPSWSPLIPTRSCPVPSIGARLQFWCTTSLLSSWTPRGLCTTTHGLSPIAPDDGLSLTAFSPYNHQQPRPHPSFITLGSPHPLEPTQDPCESILPQMQGHWLQIQGWQQVEAVQELHGACQEHAHLLKVRQYGIQAEEWEKMQVPLRNCKDVLLMNLTPEISG